MRFFMLLCFVLSLLSIPGGALAQDHQLAAERIAAMKPRDGARILAAMPVDLASQLVAALETRKSAEILAAMPPTLAAQILSHLAGIHKESPAQDVGEFEEKSDEEEDA